MPEARLSECWARDGIQPERPVATAHKREMLDLVVDAGFARVELTSFTHPRAFPQFRDAAEVLTTYRRRPGVEYAVLIPNPRGLELMRRAQGDERRADSITVVMAASAAYNEKNTRRTLDASLGEIETMTATARAAGLTVTGCLGTAWGCPLEGVVDPEHVLALARRLAAAGVDRVMLGDTTGEAAPRAAGALVAAVGEATGLPVVAHFHDPRGAGAANALAALDAGATWIDVSLGGTGGHPPEPGVQAAEAGNVCTEDLAAMLAASGRDPGLDLDRLLAAGRRAEEVLGRPLTSRVQRAGPPVSLRPPVTS